MKKLFGSIAGIFLFFLVLNLVFGGLATQYVVEYWASYSKGHAVPVPFAPCMVAGVFLGELTIPLAIVTWILHFFL